ncbi:hypothetical protein ABL78_6195 [Leptomonas seymouri]|uniref:Methyltransferase n=1 Tax=Leptomonas seymouri TaxID=5684 RepID=A0A0N1I159_LEPSE|nr:hypothetical protein ABL78_6195 [Leptomonas seymouri]|eukprot:KPI84750.1 hypothetical protein ABL78_6195 [Leptomonas seymouri]
MLRSKNVALYRTSDTPLRRLHDIYGSEGGAETQLEQYVLDGERRVKGHAPPLADSEETRYMQGELATLLADLSDYGALGTIGGADHRFCQRLQPLLTRLMKCILSGGYQVMNMEETEEGSVDVEELLQATSKALSNCSEGVVRRCADTTLDIQLHADLDASVAHHSAGSEKRGPSLVEGVRKDAAVLRVCVGFADYTSGETGAMIWAGAVGLSLYLVENYQPLIAQKAREVNARTGKPLRVIEVGCGPALVSLVLAMMATRESAKVPCCLDVTDVSAPVVDEARRSFQSRNGPALSSMLVAQGGADTDSAHTVKENQKGPTAISHPCFQVYPFTLDFSDIPPELCGVYDIVVASDVVYDHAIAAHVAPALDALLSPGGIALLCCEAHRDGMSYFTQRIRSGQPNASHLRVTEDVRDVQAVLSRLEMLPSLTSSTCSLMRIEKASA